MQPTVVVIQVALCLVLSEALLAFNCGMRFVVFVAATARVTCVQLPSVEIGLIGHLPVVEVLAFIYKEIVFCCDSSRLGVLVLIIVVLVVGKTIVVECGCQSLRGAELVCPARFGPIALLLLVVVAVADHMFHLLPFGVEHLVVDAPMAEVVHHVVDAFCAYLILVAEGITQLQIGHVHIGTSTTVVVHLLPILRRSGHFAETAVAIFLAVVILGVDRPFAWVQVQHGSSVVTLVPSTT